MEDFNELNKVFLMQGNSQVKDKLGVKSGQFLYTEGDTPVDEFNFVLMKKINKLTLYKDNNSFKNFKGKSSLLPKDLQDHFIIKEIDYINNDGFKYDPEQKTYSHNDLIIRTRQINAYGLIEVYGFWEPCVFLIKNSSIKPFYDFQKKTKDKLNMSLKKQACIEFESIDTVNMNPLEQEELKNSIVERLIKENNYDISDYYFKVSSELKTFNNIDTYICEFYNIDMDKNKLLDSVKQLKQELYKLIPDTLLINHKENNAGEYEG